METFLNFINANYIWLVVIAIIILLALIGYIAEKQGFGKKEEKKQDKIVDDKKEVETTLVEENLNSVADNSEKDTNLEDNSLISDNIKDDTLNETKEGPLLESENTINNEVNNEISEEIVNNDETKEELENIEELKDSNNTELKEVSKTEEDSESGESKKENNINKEEDLYAPFGDQEFKKEEDSKLNIDKDFNKLLENVEDSTDETDVELPKIESTTKEELEDDDIWRF